MSEKKKKPMIDATKTEPIEPVAKGEQCVVINTKPRAIQLAGVELLKPGRNIRPTAAVTEAMRNPHAKKLGLGIEEVGDPEKQSEQTAIANLRETYALDDLEALQRTEKRPNVLAAINAQIELLTKPKEDKDAE